MTLEQIIKGAQNALGYRLDRGWLIYTINQIVLDLALSMRVTRTDVAYNNYLPRQPVQILDVRRGLTGDVVTYTYVPRPMRYADDTPELPAWCHSAIITYVVQRCRAEEYGRAAA
jgi:hypothetical protein